MDCGNIFYSRTKHAAAGRTTRIFVLRTTCKFSPTQNKRNQAKIYISALQTKSRNNIEQPLQSHIISTTMRFSVLALLIALPAAAYAASPKNSNPKSCTQETQRCGSGLPACCGGNLDCRLDDKSQLVRFIAYLI